MSGSPRPSRVPAGGRAGLGTLVLSAPIHHSEKLRSRTSDGRRSSGGGVGSRGDGPQLPEPRPEDTHRPTETHVFREACHRLRAGVLTGGPALRAPLLGRHSIQPQGGGCEHRQSTEAQGAPIRGGAGGPPDTPAPGRQPCTWASRRTAVRLAGRTPLLKKPFKAHFQKQHTE